MFKVMEPQESDLLENEIRQSFEGLYYRAHKS